MHFAIKSHHLTYGESLIMSICQKKVYVVLLAQDAGKANAKKIKDKCLSYQIPLYENTTKDELSQILGKTVVALGIQDKNLSNKLIKNLQEGSESHEEKNKIQ